MEMMEVVLLRGLANVRSEPPSGMGGVCALAGGRGKQLLNFG
jgi:hypothetical protein